MKSRQTDMEAIEAIDLILEKRRQKSTVQHHTGLEEAVRRLADKRVLVITGREGNWKYSFSEDLINKLLENNLISKAALIESQQHWNAFLHIQGKKCAYLRNKELIKTKDWLCASEQYHQKEIFLIIVHEMDIYDIKHYEDNFDAIVNLSFSDFELTADERKSAMIDGCRLMNLQIGDNIEAAMEIEPKEGFLETLNIYFVSDAPRHCSLTDFLLDVRVPKLEHVGAHYIRGKDVVEFVLLAFCYLCDKDIDISILYNPNNKHAINTFVNLEEHNCTSSPEDICKTRHKLMTYNLRSSRKEILAMYGEKYPKYYIEYSVNSEFFIEHTGSRTSNVEVYVGIPEECRYQFVQRLVDMLGKEGCIGYLEDHDPRLLPFVTTEFPPAEEIFDLVQET